MSDMIKRRDFVGMMGAAGVCALGTTMGLSACSTPSKPSNNGQEKGTNVLWNKNETANKIIVVSDLHFGISDSFAQDVTDRPFFADFVNQLIGVGDVRELVIAGDFLDEWIVPLSYPDHTDSAAFFRQCIKNNQEVFDALNKAIAAGIKVVYVIGNHDMTLTQDVLAEAIPGLVQVRDAEGLGVYITGDRKEIAIEHSHRYDPYSAPDTVSNRELAGNDHTLLPPGYFYARLGTEWSAEGRPSNVVDYPQVNQPDSSNIDQMGAYVHYKIMTSILLTQYTPNVGFDEKIFQTHIAGMNGVYSEYDICPRLMDDNTISAPTLYRNFQRTWDERQQINNVAVKIPFIQAVTGTGGATYFRQQANLQYLENPNSDIEVVVFGHTHIPDFHDSGDGRYYVNDGTWIDANLNVDPNLVRTFAVITTGPSASASLYQYNKDGSATDISNSYIDVK